MKGSFLLDVLVVEILGKNNFISLSFHSRTSSSYSIYVFFSAGFSVLLVVCFAAFYSLLYVLALSSLCIYSNSPFLFLYFPVYLTPCLLSCLACTCFLTTWLTPDSLTFISATFLLAYFIRSAQVFLFPSLSLVPLSDQCHADFLLLLYLDYCFLFLFLTFSCFRSALLSAM